MELPKTVDSARKPDASSLLEGKNLQAAERSQRTFLQPEGLDTLGFLNGGDGAGVNG